MDIRKADASKRIGGWLLLASGALLAASFFTLNTRSFGAVMNALGIVVGAWFAAEGLEAYWRERMPTIFGEMTGKVAQVYGVLVLCFGVALALVVLFGTLIA